MVLNRGYGPALRIFKPKSDVARVLGCLFSILGGVVCVIVFVALELYASLWGILLICIGGAFFGTAIKYMMPTIAAPPELRVYERGLSIGSQFLDWHEVEAVDFRTDRVVGSEARMPETLFLWSFHLKGRVDVTLHTEGGPLEYVPPEEFNQILRKHGVAVRARE